MLAALVLAAGRASRMGQPKQLLTLGGETLVRRAARTALASPVDEVLVVVGNAAEAVGAELADLAVRLVPNPLFADGLSTSLVAGVRALAPQTQAVVILLADQPLLTPDVIGGLVARYHETRAPLVAPRYAGQRGNPVLFDRALFPELLAATGDEGAREAVRRHAAEAAWVDFADARAQLDVDTWGEYERVKALLEHPGG